MGLIFEEDKAKGQAVISGFVEGSVAEQRNKVTCQRSLYAYDSCQSNILCVKLSDWSPF